MWMMKKSEENLIKEKLKQAYSCVDGKTTPSSFDQDWECALRGMGQVRKADSASEYLGLIDVKLLSGGIYGFSMTVVCLLVLSVFLLTRQPTQEQVREGTDTQNINVALDPNIAWYMPTDDLLQVDVLRYEYQWVTFASYDPITMEIR
jgi:hypothetical protein